MSGVRIGRRTAALEAAVGWGLRRTISPGVQWLVGAAGLTLPLLPAAPVVRTAYLGFLVVIAVGLWVRWRGERWSDFGLKAPADWGWGFLVALGTIVACILSSSLLGPLLDALLGPNRAAAAFAELRGDAGLLLLTLPLMWLFAAFGEEAFYRGFLMTRVRQALGEGRWSWPLANVVQAVLFGLGHSYQGWSGMAGVTVYALLFGWSVRLAGGSLVPAILAHGLLDTLGFTLFYLAR